MLVRRGEYTAEPLSGWDTLGFRGTCSSGFTLTAHGRAEQILPTPFADILSQTMHPYSHIVWGSLWPGIAADAVNRARAFVRPKPARRRAKRRCPRYRLAEVDGMLQEMRHNVDGHAREYHELLMRASRKRSPSSASRFAPTISRSPARSESSISSAVPC